MGPGLDTEIAKHDSALLLGELNSEAGTRATYSSPDGFGGRGYMALIACL
jgi:hypothetical protein